MTHVATLLQHAVAHCHTPKPAATRCNLSQRNTTPNNCRSNCILCNRDGTRCKSAAALLQHCNTVATRYNTAVAQRRSECVRDGQRTACRAFLRLEQKPSGLLHVAAGIDERFGDRRRRRRREYLRELRGGVVCLWLLPLGLGLGRLGRLGLGRLRRCLGLGSRSGCARVSSTDGCAARSERNHMVTECTADEYPVSTMQ